MNNNFFRMINEDFVAYNENMTLLPQVRESLREEIATEVEEYGWNVGDYTGIDTILDEWWENKGRPMTEMFGSHPNYVKGKFMIVLNDTSYLRGIDKYVAGNFRNYAVDTLYKMYAKKYRALKNEGKADNVAVASTPFIYSEDEGWGEFTILNEDRMIAQDVEKIFDIILKNIYDGLISEGMKDDISKLNNTFHIHKGMKATKYIGKMCRELGLDKDESYNKRFTEFCDGLSPKEMKRITVLSWNPLDYLRMSMGNSWASCHTIDVNNSDDGYGGMYCGGTLSYMLDEVTVEFYTVDSDYEGNDYELQPKIERCMFYIDPEKNYFIQSRMYPQCNDGALGIYKSVREVVQKIVADSWNIDNYWLLTKGNEKCKRLINTIGMHYPDYFYFPECNISYNKSVPDVKEKAKKITVGHVGLCITCGREHEMKGSIACAKHSQHSTCYNCGCIIDEDNRFYCSITDEYYCVDCVAYCECCDEYYPHDMVTDVTGYGYVCDECVNSLSCFGRCERCGAIIYLEGDDVVTTEDGYCYCDEDCAEKDGYRYVESEYDYYHESDIEFCKECDRWVLKENYDSEHDMCNDCADELEELNEAV